MAITRSQTTGKFRIGNGASMGGTLGGAPSIGDLIVVGGWGNESYWQPEDCTDDQGNVYILAGTSPQDITECAIWLAIARTAVAPTVAINPTGAAFYGAGCATSFVSTVGWGEVDARARAEGISTAPATGSTATLSVADQLVIAVVGTSGGNQASITVESVSPAWTVEAEELSWSNFIPGEMNTRVVASTAAQSCSWALASSLPWGCVVVTIRELAAGGGGGGGGVANFYSRPSAQLRRFRSEHERDRLSFLRRVERASGQQAPRARRAA